MKLGYNFVLLVNLSDKLGRAVGTSQYYYGAVFVPNYTQVGKMRNVVALDLYIAVSAIHYRARS